MLTDPHVEIGLTLAVSEIDDRCCIDIHCCERSVVHSILLPIFTALPFDWFPANA